MIKVNGTLIDEKRICGIGPLYRTTIVDAFGSTKFVYNLYLYHYSIEIATDRMNTFFPETKTEAAKVYERFQAEYRALYNAIQDGDIEIYKTYCNLVEEEAKQQKENPQA